MPSSHNGCLIENAPPGMVLLKNEATLPWSKDIKALAVLGPNANATTVRGIQGCLA
jgi:hypothetical protein